MSGVPWVKSHLPLQTNLHDPFQSTQVQTHGLSSISSLPVELSTTRIVGGVPLIAPVLPVWELLT